MGNKDSNKSKFYVVGISGRIDGCDKAIYYNKVLPWQMVKYGWYFDYLTALIKTHYPKCQVEKSVSSSAMWDTKDDFIKEKTKTLLVGKKATLTKLDNIKAKTQPDLFGFAYKEIDEKIQKVKDDIEALKSGTYEFYWIPEDYVNNIKWYLTEGKECYARALRMKKLVQLRNEAVAKDQIQKANEYWAEIEYLVKLNSEKNK